MNSNVRKWQVAQYAYSPQARKGARSQENGWKTSPGSPEILLSWPGGDQRPSRGGSLVVFNFSFFLRFLLVSIRDSSYSFFRPSNSCYYSLTTRKDHFIIAKTITQNKRRQNILLGKICCVCGGYAGWLVLSPFWSTYMFVIFLIWLCSSWPVVYDIERLFFCNLLTVKNVNLLWNRGCLFGICWFWTPGFTVSFFMLCWPWILIQSFKSSVPQFGRLACVIAFFIRSKFFCLMVVPNSNKHCSKSN